MGILDRLRRSGAAEAPAAGPVPPAPAEPSPLSAPDPQPAADAPALDAPAFDGPEFDGPAFDSRSMGEQRGDFMLLPPLRPTFGLPQRFQHPIREFAVTHRPMTVTDEPLTHAVEPERMGTFVARARRTRGRPRPRRSDLIHRQDDLAPDLDEVLEEPAPLPPAPAPRRLKATPPPPAPSTPPAPEPELQLPTIAEVRRAVVNPAPVATRSAATIEGTVVSSSTSPATPAAPAFDPTTLPRAARSEITDDVPVIRRRPSRGRVSEPITSTEDEENAELLEHFVQGITAGDPGDTPRPPIPMPPMPANSDPGMVPEDLPAPRAADLPRLTGPTRVRGAAPPEIGAAQTAPQTAPPDSPAMDAPATDARATDAPATDARAMDAVSAPNGPADRPTLADAAPLIATRPESRAGADEVAGASEPADAPELAHRGGSGPDALAADRGDTPAPAGPVPPAAAVSGPSAPSGPPAASGPSGASGAPTPPAPSAALAPTPAAVPDASSPRQPAPAQPPASRPESSRPALSQPTPVQPHRIVGADGGGVGDGDVAAASGPAVPRPTLGSRAPLVSSGRTGVQRLARDDDGRPPLAQPVRAARPTPSGAVAAPPSAPSVPSAPSAPSGSASAASAAAPPASSPSPAASADAPAPAPAPEPTVMSVPQSVREAVAKAVGTSPATVPVHQGAHTDAMADEINAQAFTRDGEIHLAGDVSLATPEGQAVLAHELTHVVQQRGGTEAMPHESSDEGQAHEEQAREVQRTLLAPASAPEPEPLALATPPAPMPDLPGASFAGADASAPLPAGPGVQRSARPAPPSTPSAPSGSAPAPAPAPGRAPASAPARAPDVASAAPALAPARPPAARTTAAPPARSTTSALDTLGPPRASSTPESQVLVAPGVQRNRRRSEFDELLDAPSELNHARRGAVSVTRGSEVDRLVDAPGDANAGRRNAVAGRENAMPETFDPFAGEDREEAAKPKWNASGGLLDSLFSDDQKYDDVDDDDEDDPRADLERQAESLYPLIRARLRAELVRDRERRGRLAREWR